MGQVAAASRIEKTSTNISNEQEKFEDSKTVTMDAQVNIQEDIFCKGCSDKFQVNTILKHIFNQDVNCIDKYTDTEIELLRTNSKERRIIHQRSRRKTNKQSNY